MSFLPAILTIIHVVVCIFLILVVLLQQGKSAEAESQFRDALAAPPGEARFHFHLAVALERQGKLQEAKESLRQAQTLELGGELLSPGERKQLVRLQADLR